MNLFFSLFFRMMFIHAMIFTLCTVNRNVQSKVLKNKQKNVHFSFKFGVVYLAKGNEIKATEGEKKEHQNLIFTWTIKKNQISIFNTTILPHIEWIALLPFRKHFFLLLLMCYLGVSLISYTSLSLSFLSMAPKKKPPQNENKEMN